MYIDRNYRGRRRRRSPLIPCIIAAVILIAGTTFAFSMKKNAADKTAKERLVTAETVEETADAEFASTIVDAEASGQENSAKETAAPETAAAETAAPETTAEETTAAPETTAAEERFLANLDAYRPGDIIPADKIDMDNLDQYFMVYEISREGNVFARINGQSYRDNENIGLSDLRYIQLPHYNFDGNVQLGELIVNKSITGDIISIFKQLYINKYQIEKMYLIDNYWKGDGDSSDYNSIDHNNTSAFCYRRATGSSNLSRHARGLAIDINPQQNPYVSYSSGKAKWSHSNANDYIDRSSGRAHMITHDDLAYRLFKEHGFTWGGDWSSPKDYQHFEMR